jgi:hypothetical protein
MYRGFGRDVGGLIGGVGGSLIGLGDQGAEVGRWMGAGAADITGWGAGPYTVANNIVNEGALSGVPSFGPSDANTVTVTHKEFVCDIFGPELAGTFQNQTFSLNPGLQTTFPWLSQIASNFDEYSFGQLMFTYRSTVTDFVANNGQVGSVIMATQYNPDDAPFAQKQDAMEYDGAVSGKCSHDIIAGVECDPSKNSGSQGKYVRAGPPPQNEDIKTYDLGTLNVAISNAPVAFQNQALGELWVSYTVQLRKPRFFVSRALNLPTDVFVGRSASASAGTRLADCIIGAGQQNRLGCKLVPSWSTGGVLYGGQPNQMVLVLPSGFSGDIDIKMQSAFTTGSLPNQALVVSSYTNGTSGILPILDCIASGYDYVNPAGPPPTGTITKDWSNTYGTYVTYPPTPSGQPPPPTPFFRGWGNTEFMGPVTSCNGAHYRVIAPATAGAAAAAQDNLFVLTTTNAVNNPTPLVTQFIVWVSLYNTGLNNRLSGHPTIVSQTTGQIIEWP